MSVIDLDYYDDDIIFEESEVNDPLLPRTCCKCEETEPGDLHDKRLSLGFHWYKCIECGHLEEGDE